MATTLVREEAPSTVDVVAANVRAEAARQGLSQIDLGIAIGMSQGAVNKRWRGVRQWQLEDLDAVADVLGVTVNDLVTPTGREGWAQRGSNPQPTDSWSDDLAIVWAVAA